VCEVFLLGLFAGCDGFFFGGVATLENFYSVFIEAYLVGIFEAAAKTNTSRTRLVVFSDRPVLPILRVCRLAQIANAVVLPVLVDVVELLCWPLATVNEPNKLMDTILPTVNVYLPIASAGERPRPLPKKPRMIFWWLQPVQKPVITVFKMLTAISQNALCAMIKLSHATPSLSSD
jgi:hypothetical protein